MYDMDTAWRGTFLKALAMGSLCAPRGKRIIELDHHTVIVDMNYPVLRLPDRKLNYKFMAAEASWMVKGRHGVEELAEFNPRMRDFSDDGVTLTGAYGPRILLQLGYVLQKLKEDPDTRQATLTIWSPNPAPTKDHCCTIAMDFKIRRNQLNCHVFMRSSDIWLGLPYDVFSFTAVATMVRLLHNTMTTSNVKPGLLYVTAASSHLYEEHWTKDVRMVEGKCDPMPMATLTKENSPFAEFVFLLDALKFTKPGDSLRWWEKGITDADRS